MAQRLDLVVPDPAKAEAVGDIVDGAQEPRKAVDQGPSRSKMTNE